MHTFNIIVTPTSLYLNGERLKRIYTNSTRKIYLNDKHVVKVEWADERGDLWQCRKEKNLWKRLPIKHRSFFVPTLASFHTQEYDYVVQPKVKIRFEKNIDKRQKAWDWIIGTLAEKYDLRDLYFDFQHNWGFCNGKPLIVDYGC